MSSAKAALSERTFETQKSGTTIPSKNTAIQDCSFLLGVLLLSCLSYVGRLGFYSDDWNAGALFYSAKDQSLVGLLHAMLARHLYPERLVQMLYLAFSYVSFGLHALPYHLTITVVLGLAAALFYAALRELQLPHCVTLTVPLVYELLPHYSSDRFWVGAHQAILSQAFLFLGLYAALRSVRVGRPWALCLKTVSILAFSLSLLSYEVVIGLFPLSLLLIGYHMYTKRNGSAARPHALFFPGIGYLFTAGVCFGLTLVYKMIVSARATFHGSHPHIGEMARGIVSQTIRFNLGRYGAALPRTSLVLYRFSGPNKWLIIIAAVIAVSILLYLVWTFRRPQSALPGTKLTLSVFVAGFVVFLFAYVPLNALSNQLYFTIDGYSNRVAIAAATGTAFVLVGGIMLLARAVKPARLQALLFSGAIAALCTMNYVCFASLGECWAKASTQQHEIVQEVRKNVDLAPGSALIIDGFCRYVGPAPVIEGYVDARSMLQIAYNDKTLKGDVVSPDLEIHPDYISTRVYGAQINQYPYGDKLWLHNVQRKMTIPLTDRTVADNYFRTVNPDKNSGCPAGSSYLGLGSPIPGITLQWTH